MSEKNIFRKKILFPLSYACVVGLAVWGATGFIPDARHVQTIVPSPVSTPSSPFTRIEPAAGEASTRNAGEIELVQVDMSNHIPAIDETDIIETPALDDTTAETGDAPEIAPLRISPDKPEIIELERSAVNVMVGSDENLRAVPDTNRTIILIPKKPGATYFKALDENGKIIMQRHVIIGAPKNEYVRIRRACVNGEEGCKQYSLYYCPDSCHEVDVIQDQKALKTETAPKETVSTSNAQPGPNDEPVNE